MQGYKVISKGEGKSAQTSEFVNISNYVVAEKDGKRFLMLKCHNGRNQVVNGLTVRLNQFDARKRLVQSDELTLNDVQGKAQEDFVIENRIRLSSKCENVGVQTIRAQYGNYSYSPTDQGLSVDYAPDSRASRQKVAELKSKMGGRKTTAYERRLKAPFVIGIFAILMIAVLAGLLVFQIFNYKNNVVDFHYRNVRYSFASGQNQEGGDIIVTGYAGNATEITIPDVLDGHKVISIEENAFRDNRYIRKVTILGDPEIKQGAFSYCDNLAVVELGNVSVIGDDAFYYSGVQNLTSNRLIDIGNYAFSECSGLTEVNLTAPEEEVLSLGMGCFNSCTNLQTINLNSPTQYGEDGIFVNCPNLRTVKLYNFNLDVETGEIAQNTLHDFVDSQSQLETLEIVKLGSMPSGFLQGYNVISFTVSELDQTEILDDTFRDCARLTTISLPNAITSLGKYSLSGTAIQDFDVSEVTLIDDYAFADSGIVSVNLNENTTITTLGEGAFSGCANLAEIIIPKNVSEIKPRLFANCTSLVNVNFEVGNEISSLGEWSFYGCTSLRQIDIPAGVSRLTGELFAECTSLNNVGFPYMLEYIGERTFANCSALTTIEFPTSLTEIGANAFNGSGLVEVDIPQNIENIGKGAFGNCQQLEKFLTCFIGGSRTSNQYFSYVFGGDFASTEDVTPQTLKDVVLSDMDNVPACAFYNCKSIEKVTFLSDILEIDYQAFYGCQSLKDIEYPASLTYIGDSAFANCQGLRSIELPSTVAVGYSVYSGCDGLNEMTINFATQDDMNSFSLSYYFGGYAGSVPGSIKKVTLNGDGSIPEQAFNGCSYLRNVVLNGQITSIGNYAFYGCDTLQSINLPEGLQEIGSGAFAYCRTLPFISIPSTVNVVASGAFQNTYNLYEVENLSTLDLSNIFPSALNIYGADGGKMEYVVKEGYTISQKDGDWYLTKYPIDLTAISIPQNFEYNGSIVDGIIIPNNLMRNNYKVTELIIPNVVTLLGEYCFDNCSNLSTVTFGSESKITEIPDYAFRACGSLTTVNIPSLVERIGLYAFGNCGLTDIDIPNRVSSIDRFAFYGNQLSSLRLPNSLREVSEYSFSYNTSLVTIEFNDGLTLIGEHAFSYLYSLEEIILPYTVQTIMGSAFYECNNLQNVVLPSSLLTIGENAFYSCTSLQQITIPNSVLEIGNSAFTNCNNLFEVYNLSTLEITEGSEQNGYVGYYAFAVYTDLDQPSRVIYKDNYVFSFTDGGWQLRRIFFQSGLYILPEPFVDDGRTVNNYSIAGNIFGNTSIYISGILIPNCVTKIDALTLQDLGYSYIYYCGSDREWANITDNLTVAHYVYFKVDCVHGEYQWKYDEFNEIYTSYDYKETMHVQPTCQQTGLSDRVCNVCGETIATGFIVSKLEHTVEQTVVRQPTCSEVGLVNGVCSVCQEVVYTDLEIPTVDHVLGTNNECKFCGITMVTPDNFESLGAFTNDRNYPFVIDDGGIHSNNKSHSSSSTLTFTATENMEVSFRIEVSSERSYDLFTLKLNDMTQSQISGNENAYYTFNLVAGDQLTFTYSKDGSASSGNDCGSIVNMTIKPTAQTIN